MTNVSKYCYDDEVLVNKFNIHDDELLELVDREISTFRVADLVSAMRRHLASEKVGKVNLEKVVSFLENHFFSVDSYLFVHNYLFQDIYSFAGNIRDEAIYKSNEPYFHNKTPFCYPSFIYEQLKHFLSDMSFRFGQVHGREDFLTLLAYYYGEINMVHPFREGNGRTLRTYMALMVDYLSSKYSDLDFELQYSLWTPEDREKLLMSTIYCNVTGNSNMIRDCFDKILVDKNKKRKSIR